MIDSNLSSLPTFLGKTQKTDYFQMLPSLPRFLGRSVLKSIALTINSLAGPWLALANSVSEFIGCLGCRMSRHPRPAKEDSAFLASIF